MKLCSFRLGVGAHSSHASSVRVRTDAWIVCNGRSWSRPQKQQWHTNNNLSITSSLSPSTSCHEPSPNNTPELVVSVIFKANVSDVCCFGKRVLSLLTLDSRNSETSTRHVLQIIMQIWRSVNNGNDASWKPKLLITSRKYQLYYRHQRQSHKSNLNFFIRFFFFCHNNRHHRLSWQVPACSACQDKQIIENAACSKWSIH